MVLYSDEWRSCNAFRNLRQRLRLLFKSSEELPRIHCLDNRNCWVSKELVPLDVPLGDPVKRNRPPLSGRFAHLITVMQPLAWRSKFSNQAANHSLTLRMDRIPVVDVVPWYSCLVVGPLRPAQSTRQRVGVSTLYTVPPAVTQEDRSVVARRPHRGPRSNCPNWAASPQSGPLPTADGGPRSHTSSTAIRGRPVTSILPGPVPEILRAPIMQTQVAAADPPPTPPPCRPGRSSKACGVGAARICYAGCHECVPCTPRPILRACRRAASPIPYNSGRRSRGAIRTTTFCGSYGPSEVSNA